MGTLTHTPSGPGALTQESWPSIFIMYTQFSTFPMADFGKSNVRCSYWVAFSDNEMAKEIQQCNEAAFSLINQVFYGKYYGNVRIARVPAWSY